LPILPDGLRIGSMARTGPIVVGYDGSPAAERAIREAGMLLGRRPALVVVVWKQGIAWDLLDLPTATVGLPPAPLDIGSALETDRALYENAQRLARKGAGLARDAGMDAEGLAVADEPDIPIPDTLVRVARERDAAAMVLGAHGHSPVGEVLLGSTTRAVLRRAEAPVLVVRHTAAA
jgi:nucleotide-binding universal stress UspA family protein